MRTFCAIFIALLLVSGVVAQNRTGFVGTPGVTRIIPSVVFPAGTSAIPGVQRTTGSVVYPAGGNPQIAIPSIPFSITDTTFAPRLGDITAGRNPGIPTGRAGRRGGSNYVYAYPVYVGSGIYDAGYAYQPQMQQQQQPNITVIYPPQQPTQVLLQYPPDSSNSTYSREPASVYEPMRESVVEPARITEPSHYMIAFKDHSIYAAVAYWVDGETLHYFTTGNTHNQASVSLVDRELTQKLNKDTGLEVKLPE
jgi:hypothetical protein